MRSLPHALFTAQARITNCRRSRDFKVSRHSTLARGAAQATETQRVRIGQKGGFSRHAEIFSGTTSSIAVAHAINTNADEHGPPAPVVPPLVSGYSLVGCSSAEPASASPACHYNSSVRVCLSNIPISFDYELATPQDSIYQQILSTRQSKEESGVEMKKRLGERRNTPERKQGRKEESKRSSLVHFSPLDRPHTRGGSSAACAAVPARLPKREGPGGHKTRPYEKRSRTMTGVRMLDGLRGAQLREKPIDLCMQSVGLPGDFSRMVADHLRRLPGFSSGAGKSRNFRIQQLRSIGGKLYVPGNLVCRGALRIHGSRDRGRDFVDLADGNADMLHGIDAFQSDRLDRVDLFPDFRGSLGGLARQQLHLLRHNRKTSSGLTRARSLDRGIQGEQVCLAGYALDHQDDVANLAGHGLEAVHCEAATLRLLYGQRCGSCGICDLATDLTDRRAELLGRGGNRLYAERGLFGNGCGGFRFGAGVRGNAYRVFGRTMQLFGGTGDGFDDRLDFSFKASSERQQFRAPLVCHSLPVATTTLIGKKRFATPVAQDGESGRHLGNLI